jgi:hypothetical protein
VAICGYAIWGPNIFCDLRICDLLTQIFCGLKTPANLQKKFFIFLLTNTYIEYSNSNFYQIKDSAKQTCSRLLDSFKKERRLIFSVLWWKICGFAICGLAQQQNLRICNLGINQKKFADSHISEIYNCRLSPRIC